MKIILADKFLPTGWNPFMLGIVFLILVKLYEFPPWVHYAMVALYTLLVTLWVACLVADHKAQKVELDHLLLRLKNVERKQGIFND